MDRISKMEAASSLAITVGLLYVVCGVVVAMHPGALGIALGQIAKSFRIS